MVSSPEPKTCRRCGARLAASHRGSTCPACMVAAASHFPRSSVPAEPAEQQRGEALVFGDYLLEQELAHGGSGVVYKARQLSLNRTVAVKLLLLGRYSSASSLQRFQREAQSAAALRHPALIAVHEVGETDGQPFIAMEYVGGGSLADKIREHPLPPRQAAETVRAVALALQHAHDHGVLHRDVKPSNILFDSRGEVRVGDFGLAKKLDGSTDLTLTGHMAGTPNYMAPEMAGSHVEAAGVPGDVYSLGAVLYECLTGRPPFMAQSLQLTLRAIAEQDPVPLRSLNAAVPPDLETVCLKALARDPAQRFPSAAELAAELSRWLKGEPILTRPASRLERLVKWTRRHPALAGLGALTLLAIASTIVILTLANHRVEAQRRIAEERGAESRARLARMHVASGNRLVEDGMSFEALGQFAEALALEESHPDRAAMHRRRFGMALAASPALVGHYRTGGVWNARFSPDGTQFLCGTEDGGVCLRRVEDGGEGQLLETSGKRIRYVLFAPDGRPGVVDVSGDVQFYGPDGKPPGPVLTGAIMTSKSSTYLDQYDFSADGQLMALAQAGGGVQVYRLDDGTVAGPLLAPGTKVMQVRFHPNSRQLGLCGFWGAALYNLADGRLDWLVEGEKAVRLMAFSADGWKMMLSPRKVSRISIWEIGSRSRVVPDVDMAEAPYGARFSPDGKRLLLNNATSAQMIETGFGRPVGEAMKHSSHVMHLDLSQDGNRLATGSFEGLARVWDAGSGQPVTPWLPAGTSSCEAVISPNGTGLLTYCGGAVKQWRLRKALMEEPAFPQEECFQVLAAADGKRILTAGREGLRVISLPDRKVIRQEAFTRLSAVTWGGDGKWLGAAEGNRWHFLSTQPEVADLPSVTLPWPAAFCAMPARGAIAVVMNREGQSLLIQGNLPDLLPLPDLKSPGAIIQISPDGRFAAGGGEAGDLWIFDVPGRKTVRELSTGPGRRISYAAFSPDNRSLLIRAPHDSLRMERIDLLTGESVGSPVINAALFPPAFSASGSVLTTGLRENELQILPPSGVQPAPSAIREVRPILAAALSPDQSMVALKTDTGKVTIREVATGDPLGPAIDTGTAVLSLQWLPDTNQILVGTPQGAGLIQLQPMEGSVEVLRGMAQWLAQP